MTTTPTTTSGAADLPDAMHMAELLENPINVVCQKTAAAVLRHQHSELERLHALAAGQATAAQAVVPPNAITASVMRDDGGEAPAFCLMAAYRSEKDAMDAFALIAAAPVQPAAPQGVAYADAHGAIMGAAYDFRDAHISGSPNQKRSAHASLESAVTHALRASHGQAPAMIGASTHQQVFDALDAAHELSGPPHERIKHLTEQRGNGQAPAGATHFIHKKTGGRYRLIGLANLQTDKPLNDMSNVTVYRGEDGRLWAREGQEFVERFAQVGRPFHLRDDILAAEQQALDATGGVLAVSPELLTQTMREAAGTKKKQHSIDDEDFEKITETLYGPFLNSSVHATRSACVHEALLIAAHSFANQPTPSPQAAQAAEIVPAPPPPPECETEAEKRAFAFGWFKALESERMKADSVLEDACHAPPLGWRCTRKAEKQMNTEIDDSIVRDAMRYRWLAAHCRSTSEHWGGRWSIIVEGPAPKTHDSEDDFDAAIDAAMNKGGA